MDNAHIIIDKLKEKAEKGDTEAIITLLKLEQNEQEGQLRKDLFGV